ncbi:MAG: hypothetical protein ACRYGG_09345, partial [Janthinobacterium lividum]
MSKLLALALIFLPFAAYAQTSGLPAYVSPATQQAQQAQAANASNASNIITGTLSVARLPAQTVSFGSPIEQLVITAPGTYSGLRIVNHNPTRPAIQVNTTGAVIIQNSMIESAQKGIGTMAGCNLTLTNNMGVQLPSGSSALGGDDFLYANSCASLSATHNTITGFAAGFYIAGWSGTNTLSIRANEIFKTDDRYPNGDRPAQAGLGHAIIVTDGSFAGGADISYNHVQNSPFEASSEDVININDAYGTASNLIQVQHNLIDGAFGNVGYQYAYTGTGIITDGSGLTAFVNIANNHVVNFMNSGIETAIGHDITVAGNDTISTGQIPNRDTAGSDFYERDWLGAFPTTSAGLTFGAGVQTCAYNSSTCYNITASNNTSGFIGPDATGTAARYDFANPAGNAGTSVTMAGSTSISPASETSTLSGGAVATAMAAELTAWRAEYDSANTTAPGSDKSLPGSVNGLAASSTFGAVGSIAGHMGAYLPSTADSR